MSTQPKQFFQLCIVGSADFVRRMTAAARAQTIYGKSSGLIVSPGNLSEARAQILSERPHLLLFDIGMKTSKRDLLWLRALLSQVRERFGRSVYVIAGITSPERFAYGGNLLFANEDSLSPSGFIDNVIIAPPPGVPTILPLEAQLRDILGYAIELMEASPDKTCPLPALWDDGWVPVMCDPESRNIWMRWLPRYARYVNENPIIVGPTGSGKTRLAMAIHQLSGREGPFVSITPRDFSSTELVQAELFGAVAGAYTGAVDKWGLVRKAEKGTLFIDELQSIDRDLQGKLITFIENKSYRRVGEAESHTADVRFVFATNRSLQDLVDEESLRDDFAYRLERLQIELASLHHRRLDISAGICFALAKVLRERSGGKGNRATVEGFTTDAYQILFASTWPGNLRQLENTVAKLIEYADIKNLRLINKECTCQTMEKLLGQTEINATDIFERAAINVAIRAKSRGFPGLTECVFDLAERARAEALEISGGDVNKAAELIRDSTKAMQFFAVTRS